MSRSTPIENGVPLHLFLLGGFRVERAGKAIPDSAWRRRSGKLLVKILATEPSHRLHREQILDMLWPDLEPESASISLRKAIHFARHALEPGLSPKSPSSYIIAAGEVLQLSANVWVDADHFEALARESLASRKVDDLQAALHAFSGELLPEDRYEQWTAQRSARVRDLHLRLLLALADELERLGAWRAAGEQLKQALAVDPTQEEVLRRLMRLHARTGNRHEALRQFQASRDALRRDLDTEPEMETLALHTEILAGGGDEKVTAARAPQAQDGPPLPPAIRRVPTSPFIGRERARALLIDGLARAAEGEGGTIMVGGEAGVGKTRLVAEIARESRARGCLVLWGASYAQEGIFPYGPLVEALDGYLSSLPLMERDHLAASYPELRSLLPTLSAATHAGTSDDPLNADIRGPRALLFAAIVRLLDELAGTRVLMLVLDDLHAADTASLQLLHHLGRAATTRRWLIAATYREDEVAPGSELQALIAELTRRGLCRRIQLLRLGRHESDRLAESLLAGGTPSSDVLDQLYRLSLGNPLFIRELLEDMQERHELVLNNGRWEISRTEDGAVPPRVRDLVDARVDRLSTATQGLLDLAAVAGMEVPFADLEAATEAAGSAMPDAEHQLLEALDAALRARILEEGEIGYSFTHPLLRATLYDRLARHRRAHLHGLLARVIEEQRPDEIETLAYHYARSTRKDRAVVYLERAGDRAREVYTNDAATGYYTSALECLGTRGDAQVRARLLRKRADMHHLTSDYAAALEDYREARSWETDVAIRMELWRQEGATHEKRAEYDLALRAFDSAGEELAGYAGAPDSERALTDARIDITVSRALVLMRQGDIDGADAAVSQALDLLPDALDDLRMARVTMTRGMVAQRRGDVARVEDLYLQAARMAEAKGDLTGQYACYGNLGALANEQGRYDRAIEYLTRSVQLAERSGDRYSLALQYNNLGVNAHERGDYGGAEEYYRRSIALREELGDPEGLAVCFANLGEIASFRGQYDIAERELRRALGLEEQVGDRSVTAHIWFMLGDVSRGRGRLDEAVERYRRSLEIRETVGERPGVVQSTIALGWIACERGDVEHAYTTGRQMRRLAHGRSADLESSALLLQARARLRAHRSRPAEMLASQARVLAVQHDLGRTKVEAGLLRAAALLNLDRPAEASETARAALHEARQRQLRAEEGQALRLLGRCLLRDEKVAALRESLRIFDEIGAELEAARTRALLAIALISSGPRPEEQGESPNHGGNGLGTPRV